MPDNIWYLPLLVIVNCVKCLILFGGSEYVFIVRGISGISIHSLEVEITFSDTRKIREG